jgi:hypothetical protein
MYVFSHTHGRALYSSFVAKAPGIPDRKRLTDCPELKKKVIMKNVGDYFRQDFVSLWFVLVSSSLGCMVKTSLFALLSHY